MNKCGLYLVFGLTLIGLTSADQIEELCKGNPVELKTVGDIRPLIKAIRAGEGQGCSDKTRQAILDLQQIVNARNVCSVEVAKIIGQYYARYIGKKSVLQFSSSLSDSIKNYFLALSAKISGLCEDELVHGLKEVSKERISEEEADELHNFNINIKQLSAVIGGTGLRIEDLAVVVDLDGIVSKRSTTPTLITKQILSVNHKTKEHVERIKSLCHNKFKPVYDKLITPLVILTNLGFAYTPSYLEPVKQKFRKEPIYQNWFSAVLICESTIGLKVIDTLNEGDNGATILAEQDLAKLAKGFTSDKPAAAQAEAPLEYELNVRMMDYTKINDFEVRNVAETVTEKRKAAKKLREQVLKRLMNHLMGLTESDSLKVGLNDEDTRPGQSTTSSKISSPAAEVKRTKIHWKRRTVFWLGGIAAVVGLCTANPFLFLFGVATVAGMILSGATGYEKTR